MERGLRERKKRETRCALADAALRLAAEHGLDQVTVDQISAAANVSTRTFFNYFSSKEEAVASAGLEGGQRLCDAVRAAPPELPARDALHQAMRAEAVALQENPEPMMMQYRIADEHPAMWSHLVGTGERLLHDVTVVIAERLGTDTTRDPFPGLLATAAGGVFRSCTLHWYALGRTTPLTDLVDEAFARLAAGLPDPPKTGGG
jgi:AcrR family transcriptional regulator